jgi:hypothetical protein
MELTGEIADTIARSSGLVDDDADYNKLRSALADSEVVQAIAMEALQQKTWQDLACAFMAAVMIGYSIGKGQAEAEKLETMFPGVEGSR